MYTFNGEYDQHVCNQDCLHVMRAMPYATLGGSPNSTGMAIKKDMVYAVQTTRKLNPTGKAPTHHLPITVYHARISKLMNGEWATTE